jgi:hypothetical protein
MKSMKIRNNDTGDNLSSVTTLVIHGVVDTGELLIADVDNIFGKTRGGGGRQQIREKARVAKPVENTNVTDCISSL